MEEKKTNYLKFLSKVIFPALCINLCACETNKLKPGDTNDDYDTATRREKRNMDDGRFFGEDTLVFGDSPRKTEENQSMLVNKYLWRASLEVLSFIPLASADPFGGTITTDWHQKSGSKERTKVNVLILGGKLRADTLKISVFKQILENGSWVDVPSSVKVVESIENSILTKARQLRLESGV